MRYVYLILLSSVFIGCDPYSKGLICNKNIDDIRIIIQLDREEIRKLWYGQQEVRFLKEFTEPQNTQGLVEIEIDTVNLIGKYKIEKGICADVGGTNSSVPNFIFNYLEIQTAKDTILYKNDEAIEAAFKHIEGGRFELIVE